MTQITVAVTNEHIDLALEVQKQNESPYLNISCICPVALATLECAGLPLSVGPYSMHLLSTPQDARSTVEKPVELPQEVTRFIDQWDDWSGDQQHPGYRDLSITSRPQPLTFTIEVPDNWVPYMRHTEEK